MTRPRTRHVHVPRVGQCDSRRASPRSARTAASRSITSAGSRRRSWHAGARVHSLHTRAQSYWLYACVVCVCVGGGSLTVGMAASSQELTNAIRLDSRLASAFFHRGNALIAAGAFVVLLRDRQLD